MDRYSTRGMQLRFEKLVDDYQSWASYCRALRVNKWVWVSVVTPRPIPPPELEQVFPPKDDQLATAAALMAADAARVVYEAMVKAVTTWDRKNEVALSDVMMEVKPHILNLVADCTTAAEVWDNQGVLFEDNTTSRRSEPAQELSARDMHAGETVIKYIGRAKGLRNQLTTAGIKQEDTSLALHVLRGLIPGYAMIRPVQECVE